ncbi:hypothetical protein FVEG_15129 [Fusarium verticillioides 7600]|uniref:Uncharacterized protein n=1 Tax=Gibberella moniliformis (strain M3125 / FGSC 7600) TaxID=334819 RepID=W7LLR2_GIBM7|nr:hypothetical protein FVEG_15129 [Fusarium verticillioides 7600]XP_018746549.1 hypothetical protein FVEG_15129 [Fusarium verticillioides 7600]XP_018746550.1 hypothetical protein FVEG_15129 [Fusarium verticillioides 7600]EWG40357.1 hypothetical protein FVEG_15129 [Fusarium verticillioides 7600]EWG40358.1 hypothetical protein FVEG_15129 [Fusarium verticillioides 7600]EWG40359.1 hypothetical protein FVEG_15129 [Fusarium verticillioides 7600]
MRTALSTGSTRGGPQMQGGGRAASRIPLTGNIPLVQVKCLHYRRRLYILTYLYSSRYKQYCIRTCFRYIPTKWRHGDLTMTIAVSECGPGGRMRRLGDAKLVHDAKVHDLR